MSTVGGAPSRTQTYTTGEVIQSSAVTENEDNIFSYLQAGVEVYKDSTIESADIIDNTIEAADINTGAVATQEILDGTIITDDISDGTIINADVSATAAINASKLADNEVGAEEIDETDNYGWSGSDTHTGTLDASGGTLITNTEADCSGVTAEGSQCWDTDDDLLYVGDSSSAKLVGAFAAPSLTLGTSNVEGTALTGVRTDATILTFDATAPVTQAFGDSAATGAASVASRRDHTHGMPGNPSHGQTTTISDGSIGPACGTYTEITANVTVTATANPVIITAIVNANASAADTMRYRIDRDDGTPSPYVTIEHPDTTQIGTSITWIDDPGAGSTTYNLQGCKVGGTTVSIDSVDFDAVALQ